MEVPSIASERLDLVSMSLEFMRACLEGDLSLASDLIHTTLPPSWPGEAARTMRRRVRQLEADPTEQPWLLRAMVLREPSRMVIGRINFHAPPDPRGVLEIGYAVEPAYRRRGYATEAVEAMLGWATREHGIRHFVASVAPTNVASLALVKTFGFVQTGSQWDDEDGDELVFELLLP